MSHDQGLLVMTEEQGRVGESLCKFLELEHLHLGENKAAKNYYDHMCNASCSLGRQICQHKSEEEIEPFKKLQAHYF